MIYGERRGTVALAAVEERSIMGATDEGVGARPTLTTLQQFSEKKENPEQEGHKWKLDKRGILRDGRRHHYINRVIHSWNNLSQ